MILTVLSVIRSAWPFIRETFFQGKTTWQIVKTNKLVLFLTLSLSFSVYLNYLSIGKLLRLKISPLQPTDTVKVEEVVKNNQKELTSVVPVAKAEPKASAPVVVKPVPAEPVSEQQAISNDIRRRLEKLKGEQ